MNAIRSNLIPSWAHLALGLVITAEVFCVGEDARSSLPGFTNIYFGMPVDSFLGTHTNVRRRLIPPDNQEPPPAPSSKDNGDGVFYESHFVRDPLCGNLGTNWLSTSLRVYRFTTNALAEVTLTLMGDSDKIHSIQRRLLGQCYASRGAPDSRWIIRQPTLTHPAGFAPVACWRDDNITLYFVGAIPSNDPHDVRGIVISLAKLPNNVLQQQLKPIEVADEVRNKLLKVFDEKILNDDIGGGRTQTTNTHRQRR